jgi:hypothetical protein
MKARVSEPVRRKPLGGRHRDRPAEGARGAEADVVEQHDQDVRGTQRRSQRLDRRELGLGVPRVVREHALVRTIRDRQVLAATLVAQRHGRPPRGAAHEIASVCRAILPAAGLRFLTRVG